jgi:hypothetical protein
MSRRAISARINPKPSIAKPIDVRNGITACFWFQASHGYATVTTGFKLRTDYVNLPPAICPDDFVSRGWAVGFPPSTEMGDCCIGVSHEDVPEE